MHVLGIEMFSLGSGLLSVSAFSSKLAYICTYEQNNTFMTHAFINTTSLYTY